MGLDILKWVVGVVEPLSRPCGCKLSITDFDAKLKLVKNVNPRLTTNTCDSAGVQSPATNPKYLKHTSHFPIPIL